MNTCTNKSLRMAITAATAAKRLQNFAVVKKEVLDPILSPRQEISGFVFDATGFSAMAKQVLDSGNTGTAINGMRIYIATYPDSGTPGEDMIPPGFAGKLALVFAPTQPTGPYVAGDTGVFYGMQPIEDVSLATEGDQWQTMPKDIAAAWVSAYHEKKLPALSRRIHQGDTRCLWFNRADFLAFIEELDCRIAKSAVCLQVAFGAYDANEVIDTDIAGVTSRNDVNGQLMLVFTIMEMNVSPGEQLPRGSVPTPGNDGDDYDTGVPCPPADGCSGGLLP